MEASLLADGWQDMAHKVTGKLKIHPSGCALPPFGFAARGNQTVNSFCAESQLTVCMERLARHGNRKWKKLNLYVLLGNANGWH